MTFRVPDDWIERAARALYARTSFVGWEYVTDKARDAYRLDARAALEAAYWPEAALALEAEAAEAAKKKGRGK